MTSQDADKETARAMREDFRTVLLQEWDPIGVAAYDGARDEYDFYADHAYVMCRFEHATQQDIADYLLSIEDALLMGPSDDVERKERRERAAVKLAAILNLQSDPSRSGSTGSHTVGIRHTPYRHGVSALAFARGFAGGGS